MRYFCTYFDQHYLPRGLALYHSLKKHVPDFQLWVLCLDQRCHDVLEQLGLENIHPISFEDFERGDERLLEAKRNRSRIEYYFTCTPSLLLFVFEQWTQVETLTYLDADLFFFADPAPVFEEIDDNSIAITEHRFPENLRYLEKYGKYNVGWLSFKRDMNAMACLRWWRERCLEWCHDYCEGERFADQKYLDDWQRMFEKVHVVKHKGLNMGPWNLSSVGLKTKGDRVFVGENPLICFHFHNLKQINGWIFQPSFASYRVTATTIVRENLYRPYVQALVDMSKLLLRMPVTSFSSNTRVQDASCQKVERSLFDRVWGRFAGLVGICRDIALRQCILVVNGWVI